MFISFTLFNLHDAIHDRIIHRPMLRVRFPFLPFPPCFVVLILCSPFLLRQYPERKIQWDTWGFVHRKVSLFEEHLSRCIHHNHTARCKNRSEVFVQASRFKYVHPDITLNNSTNGDMFTGWILTRIHSLLFLSTKRYLTRCALRFMCATDVQRRTKSLQVCSVPAECRC